MKSRPIALLCLLLLVALFLPNAQASRADPAPNIGLGFGPSDVQPISNGLPIFTHGDNFWFESYYNFTIDVGLDHPDGSVVVSAIPAEPGQLFMLYTFQGNDPTGVWRLEVTTPAGLTEIPVVLGSPDSSLVPSFAGDRLSGNRLNQTFNLPATDAYNIEVCTMGKNPQHQVGFGLLGGLNGTVEVTLGDNSTAFVASGIPSSISLWIELFSPYSYGLSGGGTASQSLLAASTSVVSFSPPGGAQSVPVSHLLPLRLGRFDLRVFVRTSAGLGLHDFQFLRTAGGAWTSLAGCTSTAIVSSRVLSLTTDLDSANSTWPRQLLTMYSLNGEESYTRTNITGAEAAIRLKDFPDGKPLSGVTITASAPGLLPTQWEAYNSSVYVLTSGHPTTLSLTLSFSGVITRSLNASVTGPYYSKSISVPAGTLVASTTAQGSLLRNATIEVASGGSQPAVVKQSPPGSASLLLPPGNYTVSATFSGSSASEGVTVTPGHVSAISIDLSQSSVPIVTYLLVAAGVAGVIANIFVWRQYLERRKVYT